MLSYSLVASNNVATTTPTVTTGAFTPANGSLLVAIAPGWVPGSRTAPQSITDSAGLTWTQRVFREDPAAGSYPTTVAIWTAPVATGTSMTVTVNYGDPSATDASGKQSIYVVEVTGHNSSSPIVQTFNDGASGNPLSFSGAYNGTLSSAPASTSLVLAVAGVDDDRPNGDSDIVVGTGWTQIAEDFAGNPYNTCQIQARTGSTSTSVAWNAFTAKWTYSVAAIEIAEASSAPVKSGTVTFSTATSVSGAAHKRSHGSATMSAAAGISGAGHKRGRGSALISVATATSGTGRKRAHHSVVLPVTGILSSTGRKRAFGRAVMNHVVTMSGGAAVEVVPDVTLHGSMPGEIAMTGTVPGQIILTGRG